MPFALTNESFTHILDQVKSGDQSAVIKLNLILFATSSDNLARKARQILLTEAQLAQLQSDPDLTAFCALHLTPLNLAGKALTEDAVSARVDHRFKSEIELPKTDLAATLCGTEAWLKDLGVGYYGPTVTWNEVMTAYQKSGIGFEHLNAIVSVIRPGSALHGESQVINGIGLTANTYLTYVATEAELSVTEADLRRAYSQFDAGVECDIPAEGMIEKKIPVIRMLDPHAELSLAQFASLMSAPEHSPETAAQLGKSLATNDYSVFGHQTLMCAVRVVVEQATIRQQFDPAKFIADGSAPNYELARDKGQYLSKIPAGLLLDLIVKISQMGADLGLFDTAVHIHGISPEIRAYCDAYKAEHGAESYADLAKFNAGLCDLLIGMCAKGATPYSGHVRHEMPGTSFALQQVFFIQSLSSAYEVYSDGRSAAPIYGVEPA